MERNRTTLEPAPMDSQGQTSEMAERLHLLVQHVSDVVMITSADGTIQYLSPAAERGWGYKPADLIGTSGAALIHPGDLASARRCLHEVVDAPGTARLYEARLRHADGAWLEVEFNATNHLDTPSIAGIVVSARDITARKRAVAEVSRREAVLAAISFAAEQFLLCLDWDQNIDLILEQFARAAAAGRVSIYENTRAADGCLLMSRRYTWAEEAQGDAPDAALLQDVPYRRGGLGRWETLLGRGQMIHGDVRDFPACEHHLLAALEHGSILIVPIFVEHEWWGFIGFSESTAGRQWRVWEMEVLKTAADIFGAAIQRQRLETNLRTLNADLERRVAERTRQLEEANRAKTDFLARLSHELRTPLNAILGFAQVLTLERRKPAQREHIQHILAAGQHLLGLTNETLDIARIEAGHLTLAIEPLQVHVIVDEVLALMQPLAVSQHVTLCGPPAGADVAFVLADRQRLVQILLNLFSNAIKYNHEGGTVSCTWDITPGAVRIAVHDTGVGIATADRTRLFHPFVRLESHEPPVEGTGIGLAVSKQLVEAMAGQIGVESTLREGSTFWISLPGGPIPAEPPAPDAPPTMARAPGAARQLLYIDDDSASLRLVAQLLLYRPGLRLLTATLGSRGLDLARTRRPDLILLNLQLPDRSGDVILHTLQQDAATASIPVIIVSADGSEERRATLLSAGAAGYVIKPFDVTQMLSIVDAALRHRRS